MSLRYLSVCSGIEAATQAWHPLGWTPAAFSEIEAFPSAVLAHHYPHVPNRGDMTKFQEWPDDTVDLLCGGTPCQSFSVAGLRQGLADPRGNLMLTFGAIAGRYRPRWLVWENVPGVLSSNGGRDFAAFLGLLGELGYGWAYRVLDAQHVRTRRFPHAVPQRRRRVFVVGYLGDWRRAAAVLFDRESLSGHPAPRREAGQRPAPTISARPTGGGGLGTDFDLDGGLIAADCAPTLNAHFGDKQGLENQHINGGGACSLPPVSLCLNAGGMGRIDAESETLIPTTGGAFDVSHALRGEGFDASEDGTGRGTPLVPIAIQERAVSENMNAGPGGMGVRSDGAAYTLEARTVPQAVAFDSKGTQVQTDETGTAPTLRAMGHADSHQNGGGQLAVAFAENQRGELRTSDTSPQLTTGGGKPGQGYPAVAFNVTPSNSNKDFNARPASYAQAVTTDGGRPSARGGDLIAAPWAVRRLTPRECERLQGFPDDFTLIPYRGKPASDGPRYKALGNSWAVNCAEWIGERIAEVDQWGGHELEVAA